VQILVDYQGRQIRLTDERLAHILEHPEMASMEAAIQAALSDPEVVRVSKRVFEKPKSISGYT
jgi:hypothetical protein